MWIDPIDVDGEAEMDLHDPPEVRVGGTLLLRAAKQHVRELCGTPLGPFGPEKRVLMDTKFQLRAIMPLVMLLPDMIHLETLLRSGEDPLQCLGRVTELLTAATVDEDEMAEYLLNHNHLYIGYTTDWVWWFLRYLSRYGDDRWTGPNLLSRPGLHTAMTQLTGTDLWDWVLEIQRGGPALAPFLIIYRPRIANDGNANVILA